MGGKVHIMTVLETKESLILLYIKVQSIKCMVLEVSFYRFIFQESPAIASIE